MNARGRLRWGIVVAAVASLLACGPGAGPAAASAGPPPGLSFGTLVSDPARAAQEAGAGVSVAMVEIHWDRFEPADGEFDEAYLGTVRDQIERLRAAGRRVTLEPTLHYTPDWVKELPNGRLVDDQGNVSEEANLIFNQRLRNAAEEYLAKVASEIDFGELGAVRVTSAAVTEVLYPDGDHYWAFDPNAQNGSDLPDSMERNPAPGWRPGEEGLPTATVRQWADWYVGALNDVVDWQLATYAKLGFRGTYEVLTPGVGVQPKEYEDAVARRLPPGLLGAGAAWSVFYRKLPRRPDVVAYVSSVGDNSGGNGSCRASDDQVPLTSPAVATWSSTRWITRLAHEYGFAVSGENPGWNQSDELDESYRDLSDKGMLAAAVRQARTCGLSTFYWAHDENLWDGTVPFSAYAERIAHGN